VRVLIALGGNALLRRGEPPDAAVQVAHVKSVASTLAAAASAHEVVITHGNGPQVGLLALESANDASLSRPYPLDSLVAETQGLIGYWLQQSISAAGYSGRIVTLITQTVVAVDDPAFADPTKFVGSTYSEATAHQLAAERVWVVKPDGDAWRRVVPSPLPVRVVETPIIEDLVQMGTTVICAGGGGIPVVEADGRWFGVEAVVDKDHVAALLALELDADLLVLLTDVPAVMADFGTPTAHPLGCVTVAYLGTQSFAAGSMGPKISAACRFVNESGRTAVIGSLDDLASILAGSAGTRIAP